MSEFGETASIHHYLLGRGRPGPDDIRAIGIERMTSEIRRLPRSARPVEDVRPAPLPVLPPECEGRAALALAPDAGRTWAITPRPLRHDRWSRCVSEPMGSVACHVVKARSGALHVYLAYRSRHPLGRLRSAGAIQASCPDTVLEYWPALFDRAGRRDRASMPHILSRVRGLLSRFGPSGDGDTSETAIYRFRLAPSPLPESMASQYPRTGPPEEAMHIPAGEVAFLGGERMTAHDYLIEQYNDYANMKILEGKPHGRREFSSQFYLLTPSPFGRSQHDQPSWVMTGGYDPTP